MSGYVLTPTALRTAAISQRNVVTWWVAGGASLASLLAWSYFNRNGVVLAYQDAISHMEIARRVLDSPTAGFGQLGGVWLPLPHFLMLPFVWNDPLYYSGIAGCLVSMASYVVTSVLLYKIVLDLTNGMTLPALVAALVFMCNPNVLYMQSTPMTELLLFACLAGMVYGAQRWVKTDDHRYLLWSGVAAFLATLTRYEAWVLLVALTATIVAAAWWKGYDRAKIEGLTLAFLFVAGLGIISWLIWNQVIFGDALSFQTGKYAKPSLWVGEDDVAVGNWAISLKTYWLAMSDNLRLVVIAPAVLGLLLLLRDRLGPIVLPALSLLVLFPFFVMAIHAGQRPLHVTQVSGDLYNVRFGLPMVLPAAILIGYLAAVVQRSWRVHAGSRAAVVAIVTLIACVGTATAWSFANSDQRVATLQEPLRWQQNTSDGQLLAARFLKRNYDGGKILAQFFGNEAVLFNARIALANNISEASYQKWQPALDAPEKHGIDWIVMHSANRADEVTTRLRGAEALNSYRLVYRDNGYAIYRRSEGRHVAPR